jgi:integral membrane protein
MMKGHKFDLFWLYLSFIGWGLLCILTLGIGFLWLVPYMEASQSAFYAEVKAEYESRQCA